MPLKIISKAKDKRAEKEKEVDPEVQRLTKYVMCSIYGFVYTSKESNIDFLDICYISGVVIIATMALTMCIFSFIVGVLI